MIAEPKERANSEAKDLAQKVPADSDTNLSRDVPSDRDERIEQQQRERLEDRMRWEGGVHSQREGRPEDLEREDAAIQREGIAREKPGVRLHGKSYL